MNNATPVMKKLESEEELSSDPLHHGEGDSSFGKEAKISDHVGTHGPEDKARMVSVGALVLKLVQETEDVSCTAEVGRAQASNMSQNVQLEGIVPGSVRVWRQNL